MTTHVVLMWNASQDSETERGDVYATADSGEQARRLCAEVNAVPSLYAEVWTAAEAEADGYIEL